MRLFHVASLSAPALVGLAAVQPALAWGAAGHEIVATLAQMHLYPPVLPVLCSILHPDNPSHSCSLASVATWADRERNRMRWSAALHYVGARDDAPPDTCAFPGERGWAGRRDINVLHAVRNVSGILGAFARAHAPHGRVTTTSAAAATAAGSIGTAQEALKFLVHFLGDLHQPLHLTGRDRGGNGAKVSWDGRITSLHSLWDGLLIAKQLRTIPRNYTRPLPVPPLERALRGAIYDPYIRRIMWDGVGLGSFSDVPGRWEHELDDWLACPARSARFPPSAHGAQQTVLADGEMGETDDEEICPYAWAAPIQKFNCDFIWPPVFGAHPPAAADAHAAPDADEVVPMCAAVPCDAETEMNEYFAILAGRGGRRGGGSGPHEEYPELDTPAYGGRIADEWVVEKLLAQGGLRLAAVLNTLFAPFIDEAQHA